MTDYIEKQIYEHGWGQLTMWVVYDHPTDFPNSYVARRHVVDREGGRPTEDARFYEKLSDLRRTMQQLGLVCVNRQVEDDPKIVEVWL